MKKADLEAFGRKLHQLRARLTGELQHLAESFQTAGADSLQTNQTEELGSEVQEQEVTIQMLQSEENALTEINDALARVASGKFGLCEQCEKPIPKPRLNAIPYARRCVECAKLAERRI